MYTKHIRKVAVLGSGLMGTGIAAHLAGCGLEVLLLDILPPDLKEEESKTKAARNRVGLAALQAGLKAKPAPFYDQSFAGRITVGNFEDDFPSIKDCDWIIEVVVERLDIKKQLFEKVDEYRAKGALVTSNTSGIPIHLMAEGRSADFRNHFLGTHFFNPARYMRLLEIIPTPETDPAITGFFLHFGDIILGKQTVLCKDTPAFIANRIGVYAMAKIFQLTQDIGLDISTVDTLTGPAIGRPKTGTFRLADLVGMDTAVHVINGMRLNCPDDEQIGAFEIPKFLQFLIDNKFFGNKSGKGFYQKTGEKDAKGRPVVLALDLNALEYSPSQKEKLPILDTLRQIDELPRRMKAIFNGADKGAELLQRAFLGLFAYSSNRVPELSDTLYAIDDALRAGFAWEKGPFEYWDLVGVAEGVQAAEARGEKIAPWVKEMLAAGHTSFYRSEGGKRRCFNPANKAYEPLPGGDAFIVLDAYRDSKPVYQNSEVTLHDIGDGVLCLEFHSKMNTIGEGILRGLNEAVRIAEEEGWKGLVIGNNAQNFTVGANLMMIAMMAYQQEWDDLNMAVKMFQQTSMRLRYSSVPVVMATQGYVFGGGCEFAMHCDAVMAAAESYIGLVEVGVGIIPGGAGTKEFAVRASDAYSREGDVQIPTLIDKFKTIAMAQVATSAQEAFNYGYLLPKKDQVVPNAARNIGEAKAKVLEMADTYVRPIPRKDINVLGRTGLGALYIAAHSLKLGNYASEHDIKIAHKIAWVLCGGDLTSPQPVSEQYLLDLEREAFLSLCGEQKTLERIQYMLENGKPLRN
ncbi:MAG: 3-hydroxyacyl-CoA dehydrogenase/enoyl-CoA hydratase family protein [Saprospirales bacterium]|nr:3-hydroxyacyl-CoA dehydrogenase/enoyl-CoA hydratase family protein [Saprospirales bacterium]MBK8921706.1 3-hydroxyacyl-CoA dehydrogenase/enoyl-CoA hydratase family protein [Saprospirales bacterium]